MACLSQRKCPKFRREGASESLVPSRTPRPARARERRLAIRERVSNWISQVLSQIASPLSHAQTGPGAREEASDLLAPSRQSRPARERERTTDVSFFLKSDACRLFQVALLLLPQFQRAATKKLLSLASHCCVKYLTNPNFSKVILDFFFKLVASGSFAATKEIDFILSRLSTFTLCHPVVSTTQVKTFMKAGCAERNAREQWMPRWKSRSRLKAAFWYCSLKPSFPCATDVDSTQPPQATANR